MNLQSLLVIYHLFDERFELSKDDAYTYHIYCCKTLMLLQTYSKINYYSYHHHIYHHHLQISLKKITEFEFPSDLYNNLF